MRAEPILCVDDDAAVLRLIARILEPLGYECVGATTIEQARAQLARRDFPLVLCDIAIGGDSGLELLDELAGRSPDVATMMVTGRDDPELADTAIVWGAYGYLTKPFSASKLRIDVANALHRRSLELERRDYGARLEATVRQRTAELRRAYEETVLRLSRAIEARDDETGAHVERVGRYAHDLALALGAEPDWAAQLQLATPLHDAGKIAIRDAILRKPALYTQEERQEMEGHAEAGRLMLCGSGSELLELAATVAWTHHERWDGSGYPRGLRGDEIPLAGRIVAVADVFDALTSDRPYRTALDMGRAAVQIASGAGTLFDPAVVDAFLRLQVREAA